MKSHYDFNNRWNDKQAMDNLRSEMPSARVYDLLNIFEDISRFYDRAPSKQIMESWASSLHNMGVTKAHLKEVCQVIPSRFEKFPSYKDIYEMVGVGRKKEVIQHTAKDSFNQKWLLEIKAHRAKFIETFSDEILEKFVKYFVTNALKIDDKIMPYKVFEPLVIDCWAYCGFRDAKSTIESWEQYSRSLEFKRIEYDKL